MGRLYAIDVSDIEGIPVFEGTEAPLELLYRYWDRKLTLKWFLLDFPEVSEEQAMDALKERSRVGFPAESVDGRMSGMPVFNGTRVPVRLLFEALVSGETVESFLSDYATVDRKDVIRALEIASELMEMGTYENSP